MGQRIEDRLWLSEARKLAVGDSDKIMHKGCGNRASLFIKNDPDKFWCFCHRCHGQGFHEKQSQRIKQRLPTKTGWMPEKMVPLIEAIVSEPYNFRDLFERHGIAQFVSMCRFSPDTRRVYFPDDSGSLLGLDATMQANARFYSPYKRSLAVYARNTDGALFITGGLKEYLESVQRGLNAILVMNGAAEKAALAVVATTYQDYGTITMGQYLRDGFLRDLKPFTG